MFEMTMAALAEGPDVNLSRKFPLALVNMSPSQNLRNLAPGTRKTKMGVCLSLSVLISGF